MAHLRLALHASEMKDVGVMSKNDYQSTSGPLLHAREVEDALKRNKNTPSARFGTRGR